MYSEVSEEVVAAKEVGKKTYSTRFPSFTCLCLAAIEAGERLTESKMLEEPEDSIYLSPSREYGMPCVAGTLETTRRIKNGQRIMPDGNSFVVYALE